MIVFMALVNFVMLLLCVDSAFEDDKCTKAGVPGQCVNIKNCQSAINDLKTRKTPLLCGFSGEDPIVCCFDNKDTTTSPTTTPKSTTSITQAINHPNADSCNRLTEIAPTRERKAFHKCLEYQSKLVYPCIQGTISGDMVRGNNCWHNSNELTVGGSHSNLYEFPHVVLLGYGVSAESAKWLCEGSVVSDRYIITAGHCTTIKPSGALTFIRHGALNRSEPLAFSRVYNLNTIIRHPEFKPPLPYNDIALLETDTAMDLSPFLVPACLPVDAVKDQQAIAVGFDGTVDYLQKTTLTKMSQEKCTSKLPESIKRWGLNNNTQVCYEHNRNLKDLCLGGPLQVESAKISCMYVLVGVTSFSKACGILDTPGVYTRIEPFVPWIESIVWP